MKLTARHADKPQRTPPRVRPITGRQLREADLRRALMRRGCSAEFAASCAAAETRAETRAALQADLRAPQSRRVRIWPGPDASHGGRADA